MATSGSANFAATRDEIISAAARRARVLAMGETMSSAMLDEIAHELNAMIKHWQSIGINVWTIAEATLFPAVDQVKYGAGSGATDHIAYAYDATTLSADEAAAQTVLSITSNSGMTDGDYIGIELDDGTIHWSTISSSTSTTVTIASGLASAAASGNAVFSYTSKINRPLNVIDARAYNFTSGIDRPLAPMLHRLDYQALPSKATSGSITQLFYDRQLTIGYFYLYQPVDAVTELVKFTHRRPIEDFDAAGNNPDLPQEWITVLEWSLAAAIGPMYGLPLDRQQYLDNRAAVLLGQVSANDREDESMFIQPDMS